MPKNYILRDTNSDLTGGADFNKAVTTGAATTGVTQSISIAANTTEVSYGFTVAGDPGTDGATGNYTVEVDVQTGNNAIQGSIAFARVNSAGTQQQVSANSAEQQFSAGTKTYTFTNINLGTWASGDRLRVHYRFRNTNTMSAQSFTIRYNTAAADVQTPFTLNINSGVISNSSTSNGSVTGIKNVNSNGISNSSTSTFTLTGRKGTTSTGISNSSTSNGSVTGRKNVNSAGISNSSTSTGTVVGTKSVTITATGEAQFGSLTATGNATVTHQASASSDFGAISATATATRTTTATAESQLGALSGLANASVANYAIANASLGQLSASSNSAITIIAQGNSSLGSLQANANSSIEVDITANAQLGGLNAQGNAFVGHTVQAQSDLGTLTATVSVKPIAPQEFGNAGSPSYVQPNFPKVEPQVIAPEINVKFGLINESKFGGLNSQAITDISFSIIEDESELLLLI